MPPKLNLKNNPLTLVKDVDRLLSVSAIAGGRLKTKPTWYPVIKKFKPSSIYHPVGVVPSTVGMFQASSPSPSPAKSTSSSKHTDNSVSEPLVRTPPEIVLEGDSLRNTFYERHPMELKRPVNLVETEDTLARDKPSTAGER